MFVTMQLYAGSKTNIQVVYTLYGNLKKTQAMDVGQVGFHSDKEVPIKLYSIVIEICT